MDGLPSKYGAPLAREEMPLELEALAPNIFGIYILFRSHSISKPHLEEPHHQKNTYRYWDHSKSDPFSPVRESTTVSPGLLDYANFKMATIITLHNLDSLDAIYVSRPGEHSEVSKVQIRCERNCIT